MDPRLRKDSLELLTKESERYRLERLGLFQDIREEAELLASRFPPKADETFAQWKSRCLREYYRYKGFSAFCRNNINTPGFEMLVRTLINTHLQNVFNSSPRTETDRFLDFRSCTLFISRRCRLSATPRNWTGSAAT